jgi:hypothetical protein
MTAVRLRIDAAQVTTAIAEGSPRQYGGVGPACAALLVGALGANSGLVSPHLAGLLRDDGHAVRDYRMPADLPDPAAERGVICDCATSDEPCIALADAFHARRKGFILLVTAYRTRAMDAQRSSRPFVRLIEKPVDYDVMHAVLHRLVRDVATERMDLAG